MQLNGKCVVVTGGNGALGRIVSQHAAARGARVVVMDMHDAERTDVQQCVVDLADAAQVSDAVASLGAVDALCNVAGGFAMGQPVAAEDDSQWDSMFRLNVASLRNVLKAVVPGMQARGCGRIVNVGALAALQGRARMSAYAAAKSVVMNLTQSLADELAHTGIRVNAVLPSIIDTPGNRAAMPEAEVASWVSPHDLANLICFLASDLAHGLHGALIPVTGGQGTRRGTG